MMGGLGKGICLLVPYDRHVGRQPVEDDGDPHPREGRELRSQEGLCDSMPTRLGECLESCSRVTQRSHWLPREVLSQEICSQV